MVVHILFMVPFVKCLLSMMLILELHLLIIHSPYVIDEVYRSGAIKINNFEGTNPKVVNG